MRKLNLRKYTQSSKQSSRGISLLESLVSLVILSLGILGLLSLQLRTMTDNQSASSRMIASRLADEIFERIKANPSNTLSTTNPLDDAQWDWIEDYSISWEGTPTSSTNCNNTACTGTQKAQWDIFNWNELLKTSIPDGNAMIAVSPSNPRQLVVIIGWRAKEGKEAINNDNYTAPFTISIPDITAPSACGTTHICYAVFGQP